MYFDLKCIFFLGGVKMSVFKITKNNNYTVMSNYHLRDKNLSYKAKGLLSFMLSLPDNWDYSMRGLEKISKENIKAIRTILQELEKNKYLVRTRKQGEYGRFYYDYSIYETPYDLVPYYQKGYADNGHSPKDIQINTNIINTKEKIDKDDKTKLSSFFVAEEHNRLTLELLYENYIDEFDSQIYYYDDLFEKLLEDNSYRDLMTMIHYIVPRVISNKFKDEDGNDIKNKFGYFKNAIENSIYRFNLPEDIYDNYEEFER